MDSEKETLGDRMKRYEGVEAKRAAGKNDIVLARLDGKAFHTWTQGLPAFDERLEELRQRVMRRAVTETGARLAYGQSDEITLLWYIEGDKTQPFMGYRYQKLCSVLASMATAEWNEGVRSLIPEKAGKLALFDCRVWTVPNLSEAANAFRWRERDAVKNSIAMLAQANFSSNQLHGKHGDDMKLMLAEKGIRWEDLPVWARRGTFVGREQVNRKLTSEELAELPPQHNARRNPDMIVERTQVRPLNLGVFSDMTLEQQLLTLLGT